MMHNEPGQHPLIDIETGREIEVGGDIEMQSDAKIDALLKDFFKQEVPAELRRPDNAPQLVAVSNGSAGESRQRSGWIGLSVVAASLATVALLLSQPAADPDGTAGTAPLSSSTTDLAAAKSAVSPAVAKPDVEISVTDDFNDVDRFNTVKGPVELNNKIRIKNVTVPDPETGTEIELFPELEIEIFPIDYE